MGYIIAAIVVWVIVRTLRRAAASAKQATELQQQHSPTGSHTTITPHRSAGSYLDVAGEPRPRQTGITDHKGPFLQIRQ
jgi:hypothetical protein